MTIVSSHTLTGSIQSPADNFLNATNLSGTITLSDFGSSGSIKIETLGYRLPTGPVKHNGQTVANIFLTDEIGDTELSMTSDNPPTTRKYLYSINVVDTTAQSVTLTIAYRSAVNVSPSNKPYDLTFYVKVQNGETLVSTNTTIPAMDIEPPRTQINTVFTNVHYVEGELNRDNDFSAILLVGEELQAGTVINVRVPSTHYELKDSFPDGTKIQFEGRYYATSGGITNSKGVYQKARSGEFGTIKQSSYDFTVTLTEALPARTAYNIRFPGHTRIKNPETAYNLPNGSNEVTTSSGSYIQSPTGTRISSADVRYSYIISKQNSSADVPYKPKKDESTVHVRYVDEQGNSIRATQDIKGLEGDSYDVGTPGISGWLFKRVKQGEPKGTFGKDDKEVILEYKKEYIPYKGIVTAYHKDRNTNKEIYPSVSQSKTEGDKWETFPVSVPNYRIQQEPVETSGIFRRANIEVTYYYEYVEPLDCEGLTRDNKEKVKDLASIYKDLCVEDLAKWGAKGFYNVWCILQKIIDELCKLAGNMPDMSNYLTRQEASRVYQTKLEAGNNIRIEGNTIHAVVPSPEKVDLTGYVTVQEYNKLKSALEKIITNLKNSGAWSGDIDGNFNPNRNIATGNINIFGGVPDGSHFIRTNSGQTDNDLSGGIR